MKFGDNRVLFSSFSNIWNWFMLWKKVAEFFQKISCNLKTNIYYPLICTRTCAYKVVINANVSENLACFFFLLSPVLRFALLPYYRRFITNVLNEWSPWNWIFLKFTFLRNTYDGFVYSELCKGILWELSGHTYVIY